MLSGPKTFTFHHRYQKKSVYITLSHNLVNTIKWDEEIQLQQKNKTKQVDGNPTNEREGDGQERQQVGVAYGLVRVGDSYSRAEGPMAPSIIF